MSRWLLIVLMLFQPLQWGWSSVHAATDAAHVASHGHVDQTVVAIEIAPTCELAHGDDAGHGCHDNHVHHLTTLGFGADRLVMPVDDNAHRFTAAPADPLASASLTRIERPKWPAPRLTW